MHSFRFSPTPSPPLFTVRAQKCRGQQVFFLQNKCQFGALTQVLHSYWPRQIPIIKDKKYLHALQRLINGLSMQKASFLLLLVCFLNELYCAIKIQTPWKVSTSNTIWQSWVVKAVSCHFKLKKKPKTYDQEDRANLWWSMCDTNY